VELLVCRDGVTKETSVPPHLIAVLMVTRGRTKARGEIPPCGAKLGSEILGGSRFVLKVPRHQDEIGTIRVNQSAYLLALASVAPRRGILATLNVSHDGDENTVVTGRGGAYCEKTHANDCSDGNEEECWPKPLGALSRHETTLSDRYISVKGFSKNYYTLVTRG
jgi:hypothetical protein